MKYLTLFILVLLIFSTSYSQVSLRAGMGVDYISSPSLYNYFNQNFSEPGSQIGSFRAAVNFSGEADYKLSNKFELGVDLTYRIYSYNFAGSLGSYNLSYHNIMPTFVSYYVIEGDGYEFKFGGGPGIRLLSADESLPGTTTTQTYTSTGIGFLLRAEGNTKISNELFASVLFDIRYDLNGEPKYNGINLYNAVDKSNVNFNSLSLGIGLGLTYYL